MKRIFYLIIVAVLVVPFSASAAQFKSGESITQQDKLSEDLYAAGQNLTVKGEVDGDVFGMAGIITLDGTVKQDANLTGGTITVGNVQDDLRVGGGTITINGQVGDDAMVAGGTIHFSDASKVSGDLSIAGGALILDGTVSGTTRIGAGDVQLNGTFDGPVFVQADRITINGKLNADSQLAARQVVVGDKAQIAGDVRYWQEKGAISADNALKGGSFTFDDSLAIKQQDGAFAGPLLMFMLFSLLSAALVLALFVHFDKDNKSEKAARLLSAQYWKSLLTGLIFYIVTPVLGLLLCVTLIGLPIGLFVLAMYGFIMYAAPIIAALVLTKWIDLRRTKQFGKWATFFVALGLLVALKLIAWIPFVGMLLLLLIVPAALGAKLQVLRAERKAGTSK
ncbi:MAG: polymer-forming cytoskeletal protein [Candidatus Andersenbacteria bacterium]